jgi:hypothetical protein
MGRLDHYISEGKQSNDKVVKLVIFDEKVRVILGIYFERCIPNFHYFSESASYIMLAF